MAPVGQKWEQTSQRTHRRGSMVISRVASLARMLTAWRGQTVAQISHFRHRSLFNTRLTWSTYMTRVSSKLWGVSRFFRGCSMILNLGWHLQVPLLIHYTIAAARRQGLGSRTSGEIGPLPCCCFREDCPIASPPLCLQEGIVRVLHDDIGSRKSR